MAKEDKRTSCYDLSGLSIMKKIEAVAWAAKREGQSYGQFSAELQDVRKTQIYQEYAAFLSRRRADEQNRLAAFHNKRQSKTQDTDWLPEELMTADDKG